MQQPKNAEQPIREVPELFWNDICALTNNFTSPCLIRAIDLLDKQPLELGDALELARKVVDSKDMSINVDGDLCMEAEIPTSRPGTLQEYTQFVDDMLSVNGARAVTFTRDYCLKHSSRVAMKVRSFMNGYVQRRGVPYPGVNAVLIAGKYAETWIGLHNDYCNTFLFTFYGKKRFHLWPPTYFSPDSFIQRKSKNGICFGHVDVSRYVEDAETFDVNAGDLLFIPANWWHYNQMEQAETTLGISVGVFENGSVESFLGGALIGVSEPKKNISLSLLGISNEQRSRIYSKDVVLPEPVVFALSQMKESLQTQVLLMQTSNGVLGGGEAYREISHFSTKDIFVRRGDCPVFALPSGGAVVLVCIGRMLRIKRAHDLSAMIDLIVSGNSFSVAQLNLSTEVEHEATDVVQWLFSRGILEFEEDLFGLPLQ